LSFLLSFFNTVSTRPQDDGEGIDDPEEKQDTAGGLSDNIRRGRQKKAAEKNVVDSTSNGSSSGASTSDEETAQSKENARVAQNNTENLSEVDEEDGDDEEDAAAPMSLSGNEMDDEEDSAPDMPLASVVDQKALALCILHQQMESTGMRETVEMKRDRVGTIVRTLLFKKVKFCMPAQMGAGGRVAGKVNKYMNYGDIVTFRSDWEAWIGRHVRNVINEKRSAVTQAIFKAIVRGMLLAYRYEVIVLLLTSIACPTITL
jgi:hypothetical protein